MKTRSQILQEEIAQIQKLEQNDSQRLVRSNKRSKSSEKKAEDQSLKINKKPVNQRKGSIERRSSNSSTSKQDLNKIQAKNSTNSELPLKNQRKNINSLTETPQPNRKPSKNLSKPNSDSINRPNTTSSQKSKKQNNNYIADSDDSSQSKLKSLKSTKSKTKDIISQDEDAKSDKKAKRRSSNTKKQISDDIEISESKNSKSVRRTTSKTIQKDFDDSSSQSNQSSKSKERLKSNKNKSISIEDNESNSHSEESNKPKRISKNSKDTLNISQSKSDEQQRSKRTKNKELTEDNKSEETPRLEYTRKKLKSNDNPKNIEILPEQNEKPKSRSKNSKKNDSSISSRSNESKPSKKNDSSITPKANESKRSKKNESSISPKANESKNSQKKSKETIKRKKYSSYNQSNRRKYYLETDSDTQTEEEEDEIQEEQLIQEEDSYDDETPKQTMLDILQSDYPEPKFEGKGKLGTNGYRYYVKATVDDFTCQVGDSVLVITDAVDNTYAAKILELYENRQKEKLAKVIWYARREEFGPEARSYIMNRELVLTEDEDEIPLDSMKSLITIYDSPEPLGKDANKKCQFLTDKFFCNRGYIRQREEFIALSTLCRLLKQTEMVVETVSGESKFDVARARLQLNNVPIVVGREKEIRSVEGFLEGFLNSNGRGGCVYLSGVPGTGKTLVVREVIKRLTQKQLSGDLPDFQFYEFNCLQLESPRSIYTQLWKMLNFETLNPTAAQRALHETFTMDPSPFYIIVLVDEIDLLLTSQQNELYCLTEWASLPHAKFIVIAIANLMDLETRVKPKIASRLGRSFVKFYTYKYEQLMEIIKSRVGDLGVFHENAIELCARSISGNGGDARKALETCKRAIDNHKNPKQTVSMDEISKALVQIQSIQAKAILKQVSDHQKLFLTAFLQAMKITQKSSVQIREINERARLIANQLKLAPIPNFQFNLVANQLETMNIISCHKEGQLNANSMISLEAFDQELIFILSKQDELRPFLPKLEFKS